jgi:hypothetical protein
METLALITLFTDAMSVAQALTPLIQQQLTTGKPATDEDVRAALAGKDAALVRLDALIAQRIEAEQPGKPQPSAPLPPL